jgi:isopenicillin N synthase-like dioxygenase
MLLFSFRKTKVMRPSHVDEFIEHGFAKIKASDDLLAMLRRQLHLARTLHASTVEQKRRIFIGNGEGAKGYWPSADEYAEFYDIKQPNHIVHRRKYRSFDFSLELNATGASVTEKVLHAPNIWPDWIPSFKDDSQRLMKSLHGIASTVLVDTLQKLGIAAAAEDFSRSVGTMKLMKYPPPSGSELCLPAHSDYEFITISYCDVPGLEVVSKTGEIVRVREEPDDLVVMAGDCLEVISDFVVPAPVHQVRPTEERYSIVLFVCSNHGLCIRPGEIFSHKETPHNDPFSPARYLCTMHLMNNPHLTDRLRSGQFSYAIPKDLRFPLKRHREEHAHIS